MLQSRLLRVLQEREVRRVGDNLPTNINVRVLAATNEPLEKRSRKAPSAKTSITGSTSSPSTCPGCANGSRTFRCWWRISSRQDQPAQPASPSDHPASALEALDAPRLAGQRARTRKCHRTRLHALRGRPHPAPRPAARFGPRRTRPPRSAVSAEIAELSRQLRSRKPAPRAQCPGSDAAVNLGRPPSVRSLSAQGLSCGNRSRAYLNRVLRPNGGDKEKAALCWASAWRPCTGNWLGMSRDQGVQLPITRAPPLISRLPDSDAGMEVFTAKR